MLEPHERLKPHLDKLKINYDFQTFEGVGHNLGLMKQQAAEAITVMLAQHYAAAH